MGGPDKWHCSHSQGCQARQVKTAWYRLRTDSIRYCIETSFTGVNVYFYYSDQLTANALNHNRAYLFCFENQRSTHTLDADDDDEEEVTRRKAVQDQHV